MRVPRALASSSFLRRRAICASIVRSVSGNYRYKLGRGVLRKVGESAYKRNFLEMSLKPRPIV